MQNRSLVFCLFVLSFFVVCLFFPYPDNYNSDLDFLKRVKNSSALMKVVGYVVQCDTSSGVYSGCLTSAVCAPPCKKICINTESIT